MARPPEKVLALAFVVAIGLPLGDQCLRPSEVRSVQVEFRNAYPLPELTREIASWREFPAGFDRWYGDSFGLRDRLVRWHNIFKWFGLQAAPAPSMVRGKHNWLFQREDRAIDSSRGAIPFDERELAEWRRMLEVRRDWLAERGIAYLYAVIPSKSGMYAEYLPARFERLGPSRREQFVEYMSAHSDVELVDVMPVLEEEKRADSPGNYTYFPLGTHWSDRGAVTGYQEIVRRLSAFFPELQPWPDTAFELRPGLDQGDSWAGRMYMQDVLTQEFQVLIPKRQRGSTSVDPPEWAHRAERYEHQDRSLPKAVLFHDSFGLPLIPLLSAHFSELTTFWQHDFNVSVIEALEPDVVLQVYVDRSLVTVTPTTSGVEGRGLLREPFDRSSDVLLAIDAASAHELEAYGETEISAAEDGSGVVLHTKTGSDLFYLPEFAFPERGSAVLELDISCPVRSKMDVLYQTEDDPSYARLRTYRIELQEGRNKILLNLAARGITGRLLLRPGLLPGRYLLHRAEVRAIDLLGGD